MQKCFKQTHLKLKTDDRSAVCDVMGARTCCSERHEEEILKMMCLHAAP